MQRSSSTACRVKPRTNSPLPPESHCSHEGARIALPVVRSLGRERVNGKEGANASKVSNETRGIAPSIRNEGGKEGRKNPAEKEERGPLSFLRSTLFCFRLESVCRSIVRKTTQPIAKVRVTLTGSDGRGQRGRNGSNVTACCVKLRPQRSNFFIVN